MLIATLIGYTPFASAAETVEDGSLVENVEEYFADSVQFYNQDDEDPSNDDIQVDFDEKTGTLTVSGTGVVENFFARDWDRFDQSGPFLTNKNIQRLIVKEGITKIKNSFNDLYGLKEIQMPRTFVYIDKSFVGCHSLETLEIEAKAIDYSFAECDNLKKLSLSVNGRIFFSFNDSHSLKEAKLQAAYIFSSFNNCKTLKSVDLGCSDVQESFQNCALLETVVFDQIKHSNFSFSDCPLLKQIRCGQNTYTPNELWEHFWQPEEDYSVYWEDTSSLSDYVPPPKQDESQQQEDTPEQDDPPKQEEPPKQDEPPKTDFKKEVLLFAVGGGVVLLIGLSVLLAYNRIRKKKGNPQKEEDPAN